MNLTITQPDTTGPLKIAGTLDIYAAAALRDALAQCLSRQSALAVDLSGVEACDFVALQLLCSSRKSAEAAGKPFALIAVSEAFVQTGSSLGLAPDQLSMSEPT